MSEDEIRASERATIAAWLRAQEDEPSGERYEWSSPLQWAAAEIEAGAHVREVSRG